MAKAQAILDYCPPEIQKPHKLRSWFGLTSFAASLLVLAAAVYASFIEPYPGSSPILSVNSDPQWFIACEGSFLWSCIAIALALLNMVEESRSKRLAWLSIGIVLFCNIFMPMPTLFR